MKLKNTSNSPDSTNFTSESTNHENGLENGQFALPLMSMEGRALAAKSAPLSAYDGKKIPDSGMDAFMKRGGR